MKKLRNRKEPENISFGSSESNLIAAGRRSYMDMLMPSGIDATYSDCVVIDGTYFAFVLCLEYPYTVSGAWLDDLINAGEGIEPCMYAFPQSKTEIIRDITSLIGFTKYKMEKGGDNQEDSDIQENALSHSRYMKKKLSEGEEFWYMHNIIRVSADSKDKLLSRVKNVESILAGKDIMYKRADFRQIEAFISCMPFCDLHHSFKEQTARNILTSGLSSTYPYISYELSDPSGVYMGNNDHNGSSVMLNIFDSKKYSNANMVVLGSSGYGKTTTLQMLARRMRLQNIPIMMICPFKGFEYRAMCESLGGNFIRFAPGSKQTVNIMDIRPSSGEGHKDESLLAAKLQKLQIFFSLMIPDITQQQQHRLDKRLMEVYSIKAGITMDNNSIYVPTEPGEHISFKPALKKMPILEDVYETIKEDPVLKDIAEKLESFIFGSLSFFNGQTNLDLDNDYTVADISDIPKNLIPLAMFTVLDIFWDKIKADLTQRKCLILDEVWKLIGIGGNALSAEFVLELVKTIRGFAGSVIAATQDITDFMALDNGKYGRGIINNSSIKIVLHLEEFEVMTLKDVLRLSEEEMTKLTHFQRGEGLLYAGGTHVTIKFKRSEMEKRLTSTDRAERLEMKNKQKEAV